MKFSINKVLGKFENFLPVWLQKGSESTNDSQYSDFDYELMCELYYKNEWLRREVNPLGLISLLQECSNNAEKIVLKRLLNKFLFVDQIELRKRTKIALEEIITKWELNPDNTIFIAFKIEEFVDGSTAALNFIRPILFEINNDWKTEHFLGDIFRGKRRFKNSNLKNIVLVDDFVGTGGTALSRINDVKKNIAEKEVRLTPHVFSLGALKQGESLMNKKKINFKASYLTEKGTKQAFPLYLNPIAKKIIMKMEANLSAGSEKVPLEKFSLGYEKSEAIYSWNVFNIPNNNYPIFWWNRKKNGESRKVMFVRMQ